MAVIVAILGMSGDGKTTSTIINPDGGFDFTKEGYKGMHPTSHYIINLDRKTLPFPAGMWNKEKGNYLETADIAHIRGALQYCKDNPKIKSVALDTINLYLAYKEYNDRQKLTFDGWRDVSNDLIEINTLCNTFLRPDQIAYITGHVELITDVDGKEKKVFSVIGKKSKRQMPEGFYPICLCMRSESDGMGGNKFFFQTRAQNSSAKTPIGMFADFEIPNSMKLVDDTIRKYYNI
jgi:hypothetical protein